MSISIDYISVIQVHLCSESIVRDMTVGMNEYNELVYAAAKVVTELCCPKRKRKVNARKKPSWKQKIEKEIEHL